MHNWEYIVPSVESAVESSIRVLMFCTLESFRRKALVSYCIFSKSFSYSVSNKVKCAMKE